MQERIERDAHKAYHKQLQKKVGGNVGASGRLRRDTRATLVTGGGWHGAMLCACRMARERSTRTETPEGGPRGWS
jgi:predicted Rossmann-fold nucleotide-binding protein